MKSGFFSCKVHHASIFIIPDTTSISSSSNHSRVTTTPGSSSVSSSGYPASPSVITLDSPSPPRSPRVTPTSAAANQLSSCMLSATNGNAVQSTPIYSGSMACMDLDNEASSAPINFNF